MRRTNKAGIMSSRLGLQGGWLVAPYVCNPCTSECNGHTDRTMPGQNACRSPRSCQNPLSSIQSSIRKVHRLLVWRRNRHARHQPSRRPPRSLSGPLRHPYSHLPLRRRQIPKLRTIPLPHHPLQRIRNHRPPRPRRRPGGRHHHPHHLPP